jgi:hypothetical protein
MNAADYLTGLNLPAATRVDRRVPKTLLTEYGAPTPADKRMITEGIEQVHWLAALKPGTVGVAEFVDESREYLEIAVLKLTLRDSATLDRLVELLHRAVPYPVVAVTEQGAVTHLSLAHKRWSHGEAGKTVLDGDVVTVEPATAPEPMRAAFVSAVALANQPRGNLFALYQGWMDTLLALNAARYTKTFVVPDGVDRRAVRREALVEYERLATEIARLRAAASRENQMPKQVSMNLELKRLEAARAAALARL